MIDVTLSFIFYNLQTLFRGGGRGSVEMRNIKSFNKMLFMEEKNVFNRLILNVFIGLGEKQIFEDIYYRIKSKNQKILNIFTCFCDKQRKNVFSLI